MAHQDDRSWLDRDLRSVMEEVADRWWARFPAVFRAVRAIIGTAFLATGTLIISDLGFSGDGVFRSFLRTHSTVVVVGFLAWILTTFMVFAWPFARPERSQGPVGKALLRITRGVFLGLAVLVLLKTGNDTSMSGLYLIGLQILLQGVWIAIDDAEL